MKVTIRTLVMSGIMIGSFVFATSCEKGMINAEDVKYVNLIEVSEDGSTSMIETNMQSALVETYGLTETELALLLKIKNEEKLARDVYSVLYSKWNSQVFSRISAAENNHLNAIVSLLKYYGVPDTLIDEAGKFTDSEVQTLYDQLVAKACVSAAEAYKTGAFIEELDIKDLREAIAATSNANITMVFENLDKGSRNHLRAFNRQLTSMGVIYTPIYISQDEYDQIVNSPMEKGKQYKMQGKGKRQNGGQEQGNGKRIHRKV